NENIGRKSKACKPELVCQSAGVGKISVCTRTDLGEKLEGERCTDKGTGMCKPTNDAGVKIECIGFYGFGALPGANVNGTCIAQVDEGQPCLGRVDQDTNKPVGNCKPGLECEGIKSNTGPLKGNNTTSGKCVSPLDSASNPPPGGPGPCPIGFSENGKCTGFQTGLGIIATEPAKFISSLFRILLAGSGAIALLLIIRAGFKIMTSEGKPEAIQEGREKLIAAIVGLLFLIFALVFLQVIGVDILKIPGITGGPTEPGTLDKSTSPVSYAQCRDVLRNGSSGRCVKSIQQIIGVDPADGNYDQSTEDAVRKYQSENGLFPDGVVGPCTLGSMGGYTVDQICKGPLDEPTLRKFQTEQGLVVDGQFGSCTWEALIGKPIFDNCKR
ncbi:MAG: peptidoglycan-binding protein, partial [Saprospiraceae bacterium]